MGPYPRLVIDMQKIEENAAAIVTLAKPHGITVSGVTKVSCGDPRVARAMLEGGLAGLADSRIANLERLREAGITAELMLLRTPMLSEVEEVVRFANISLNSEPAVLHKLADAAARLHCTHRVLLMVEMGDLREGILPEQLEPVLDLVQTHPALELAGLGMNLACFGGVVPTPEKARAFTAVVERAEKHCKCTFDMVSGGNSANIPLLFKTPSNHGQRRIDHLRIGEAIVLGLETVNRTAIPNTHQDAFVLEAELIELKTKPSVPSGTISQNAFGEEPEFPDHGQVHRGILALGRQDTKVDGLQPLDPAVTVLGASSDHIIVRIDDEAIENYEVGGTVRFIPQYGSLLRAYTSPYVVKVYRDRE